MLYMCQEQLDPCPECNMFYLSQNISCKLYLVVSILYDIFARQQSFVVFCSLYPSYISIQQYWGRFRFLAHIRQSPPDKSLMYLSDKLLLPFELNGKDHSSILSETDPDLHDFNPYNHLSYKCNYYLQSKFNVTMEESNIKMKIFHYVTSIFAAWGKAWQSLKLIIKCSLISLLSLASLKLTLSYTDLMDIISLVNTEILEEVELQFMYRIIWVILKDLIYES